MKRILTSFIILSALLVSGCQEHSNIDKLRKENPISKHKRADDWFVNEEDKIDPYNNLDREDYQEIGYSRHGESFADSGLKLPGLQSLIEEPLEEDIISDRLVSISVNENVPLKEVLVELARRAEIDVEIDKDISGSIIFIAKDKPFSDVIKRIANQASLIYKFEDGVLKISKDRPYIADYKFNILDITRNSSSSVSSTLSVGGASTQGGSASVSSGSTSSLDISSGDGNIWKTIEEGVAKLLEKYSGTNNGDEVDKKNAINQSALLSVNKSAGIVSVLGNKKQHEAIKKYLDSVHISITSQVLIEAKIVEVTLNDEFNSGIDWSVVHGNSSGSAFGVGSNFGGSALTPSLISGDRLDINNTFKIGVLSKALFGDDNSSLSAAVDLLETFGITRSLSNPRINTMNNQFAVLNFSQNEVYFDVSLEKEEQDSTDTSPSETRFTVDSEIKTVPIGVVLTLQPSIDLQRDEITMSIRPTLTRITDRVDDPAVAIIAEDVGLTLSSLNASIPVVEVRELDTVLKAGSGEIMVIGGLLEERTLNTDTGVPGLAKIPYLGNAFKSVSKDTEMIETVIFIKATIVPGRGVSVEDKEFYKKFTNTRSSFNVD